MNVFHNFETAPLTFDCNDLAIWWVNFEMRINPNIFWTPKHQIRQNWQYENAVLHWGSYQVDLLDTHLTNTVSYYDWELALLGIRKGKQDGEMAIWLVKECHIWLAIDRFCQLRVWIIHLCKGFDESPFDAREISFRRFVVVTAIKENEIGCSMNRGANKRHSIAATPP